MEDTPLNPILSNALTEYLEPIAPDPVAYDVIQAAGDENIRAQELVPLLKSEPNYRHYLFAQAFMADRIALWEAENTDQPGQEEIALSRFLGLLGKVPVRNLIACARMEQILAVPTKPRKTDEKISVTPSQIIPYALAAEAQCQESGRLNPAAAFSAGLHYDWLAAILKKQKGAPEQKNALQAAFKEGLSTAKIAYELGARAKNIELGKYLFAIGLLMPLGKALMTCLFPNSGPNSGTAPSWSKFVKECESAKEHEFDFYQYLERRRFPITHAELASLFVNFGALLRPIEKALYYYPFPVPLSRLDPHQFQISMALSIAARMVKKAPHRPPLAPFQERWLEENEMTSLVLTRAAEAALKS